MHREACYDSGVSGQQHIENYLNKSLEHLGMDYVDLYIYHKLFDGMRDKKWGLFGIIPACILGVEIFICCICAGDGNFNLLADNERKGKEGGIDRKLKRKIDEKKQAHGLKIE